MHHQREPKKEQVLPGAAHLDARYGHSKSVQLSRDLDLLNEKSKYKIYPKEKSPCFQIKENYLLLRTVVTSSTNSFLAVEIVNQSKECSNHQKRKKPRKRKLETNLKTKSLQEEEVLDPLGNNSMCQYC